MDSPVAAWHVGASGSCCAWTFAVLQWHCGNFFFICKGCQAELPFVFPELHTQTLRYRASGKEVKDSRLPGQC